MHCYTSCFIPAYYASLWGLAFPALLMYHVSIWNGGMEVPGGPYYLLLIIKGENRGYVTLTKRFNWFESLFGAGSTEVKDWQKRSPCFDPLVSQSVTLCSQQLNQNWVCDTLSIGECTQRSLASLQNEWVVILVVGFILSFYRYDHNTP